ncbi:unnamed protein product [Parnassius mnemosyne]|uniref:Uncharacterized protein n=1 Tax=Parnassius mnemosyne TaxID=213953 RepID=A0AAV1LKS6_9NEOP
MMACPSSKISLVPANLHHSGIASAQLRKWLEVQRTAIALIQEPWVGAGKIKGLNNLKETCMPWQYNIHRRED